VGFAGYWLPLLWADYIEPPFPGVDFDDRLGFYFFWTLPIILVYTILATVSQVRVCLEKSCSQRWGRIAVVIAVGAVCWSPFINIGGGIVK
jgi:hypothetical protein